MSGAAVIDCPIMSRWAWRPPSCSGFPSCETSSCGRGASLHGLLLCMHHCPPPLPFLIVLLLSDSETRAQAWPHRHLGKATPCSSRWAEKRRWCCPPRVFPSPLSFVVHLLLFLLARCCAGVDRLVLRNRRGFVRWGLPVTLWQSFIEFLCGVGLLHSFVLSVILCMSQACADARL